jgi:hypothetical protein
MDFETMLDDAFDYTDTKRLGEEGIYDGQPDWIPKCLGRRPIA